MQVAAGVSLGESAFREHRAARLYLPGVRIGVVLSRPHLFRPLEAA